MEPRSFKRGNLSAFDRKILTESASMEPRSFKRGNACLSSQLHRLYRLQWSHVHSNVETLSGRKLAFELFRLQWSHVHSNVETSRTGDESNRRSRASMEPRSFKRGNASSRFDAERPQGASMEPRSFKRGNSVSLSISAQRALASMEPRSFKRGNPLRAHEELLIFSKLQWSHVHSNVETCRFILSPGFS